MKNRDNKEKAHKRKSLLAAMIVIIVAIAMSLGIILGYVINRLAVLSNRISYLSDTADIILSDVGRLQSNIEATLEENSSLLESWKVDLLYTDFRTKTYTVEVTLIPKTYTDATRTIIYFGTNEYELKRDGYSYKGQILLPLGEKYDGNVTVLFIDGDKKATEVINGYKDVQQNFDNVLSGNATEMPYYRDGKFSIDSAFDFVLLQDEKFDFESLDLIVQVENEEVDKVDLKSLYEQKIGIVSDGELASTESDENMQDVTPSDPNNSGNINGGGDVSGEENDNDGNDSSNEGNIRDEGNDTIRDNNIAGENETKSTGQLILAQNTEEDDNYKHINGIEKNESIAGTYEMKGQYQVRNSQDIRIFLRAGTEDGFVFEYDLFNATTISAFTEATSNDDDYTGFEKNTNYFAGHYSVYDRKGAKYEKN